LDLATNLSLLEELMVASFVFRRNQFNLQLLKKS
jgi:hypothetical protein